MRSARNQASSLGNPRISTLRRYLFRAPFSNKFPPPPPPLVVVVLLLLLFSLPLEFIASFLGIFSKKFEKIPRGCFFKMSKLLVRIGEAKQEKYNLEEGTNWDKEEGRRDLFDKN